jgi:hypothetical protein
MFVRLRHAALSFVLVGLTGYSAYEAGEGSRLGRRGGAATEHEGPAVHVAIGGLRAPGNELRLVGPNPATAPLGPLHAAETPTRSELWAMAYQYDARVFDAPGRRAKAVGIVRRGTHLPAVARVSGKGCRRGAWFALQTGGFVCTRQGFLVSRAAQSFHVRQPKPVLDAALPFRYARVIAPAALRFHRIPTEAEEQQIAGVLAEGVGGERGRFPSAVQAELVGDYFVAIDRLEVAGERRFYRTVRGRYVREQDVELRPQPKMQGVLLSEQLALPIAFVYGEDEAPLLAQRGQSFERVGRADVHARFPLVRVLDHAQGQLVLSPDALAVPRERVRVARAIPRPAGIPRGAKWIHVDLTEQTLVAYEGDGPVFATLVSTGKAETGHATPTGLFWVDEKHVSVTMSGEDPVDGYYEVAEVPWTQFYDGSYALHGAYWHDTFGKTRSHGCTNISPSDARWLFHWSDGHVPRGLHARRGLHGTGVYITSDAEDESDGVVPS